MSLLSEIDYRCRFQAVLVIVTGILLTATISWSFKKISENFENASSQVSLARYASDLADQFHHQSRFMGPQGGRIKISPETSSDEFRQAIKDVAPALAGLTNQGAIEFVAIAPGWIGQSDDDWTDIWASDYALQKKVHSFVNQNQKDWTFFKSHADVGEVFLLGVDQDQQMQKASLVMGVPLFEKNVALTSRQTSSSTPAGFILTWINLEAFFKAAHQNQFFGTDQLELCIGQDATSKFCADYNKQGLQKYFLSEQNFQNAKHVFKLGGRDAFLAFSENNRSAKTPLSQMYLFFAFVGTFLSFALAVIILKIGRRTPLVKQTVPVSSHLKQNLKSAPNMERVIRTSKARWDYVMENLPIALFAIDEQGTFTWAGGKALKILGIVDGPIEGHSVTDIFQLNEDFLHDIRECLTGHEKKSIYSIKGNWVEIQLSPIIKTDGSFNGLIGMASDVTTEYLVRDRLDKANLHLQGLMDNLPLGIAFVKGGVIEWCSRTMEETLGFAEEELDGQSPEVIYVDHNRFVEVSERAREYLLQGKTYTDRIRCRRKDASQFLCSIAGSSVDRDNPYAGTIWVLQDLTSSLQEERERRLSRTVFDNLVEGIIVTDENNKIVTVNRAFTLITGYEQDEILGRTPSVLSSGRHDAAFFQALWAEIHEKGFWRGEFWNRRKNGDTYLQSALITCLKDDQGNVQEYVAVFSDITRDRENQEQLAYQANYDLLTGLPNRYLLADRFNQAVAWSKREDKTFALIYLDLDNFKYLNESLGHESGDLIIKNIADRIATNIREFDTVARIGGDEFVVLLVDAHGQEDITRMIANISFQICNPIKLPNVKDEIMLSATCGIAQYPKDGDDFAELSRKADSALYHAKEMERGIFMFFTEDMNNRAQERLKLENRLRKAIEREEFQLYYQPKVDLVSGEIHGAESLIRWIDPELGIIGPDKFIPIAEESGLIVPIGEWVFKTACNKMKEWKDKGLKIENLAINLSGRQFLKPDLVDGMLAIIEDIGVNPASLELEITESFIANSEQMTTDALERLSAIGVKLSVDDFGTGYSSLSYLHRFPLDLMKIDRSFIIEIDETSGADAGKIAKAVIAIAKSMDLSIVGEGVENEEQLQFLKNNGCNLMQGYYFSKPLPGDEFEKLVLSGKNLFSRN